MSKKLIISLLYIFNSKLKKALFLGEYKITESNAIMRYIGRKHGLDGKTEMEKVNIDMIENLGLSFYMEFAKIAYSPDFVRIFLGVDG